MNQACHDLCSTKSVWWLFCVPIKALGFEYIILYIVRFWVCCRSHFSPLFTGSLVERVFIIVQLSCFKLKCTYISGSVVCPRMDHNRQCISNSSVSGSVYMLIFVPELSLCNVIDQSLQTHLNRTSVFQVKVKMYLRINLTETETDTEETQTYFGPHTTLSNTLLIHINNRTKNNLVSIFNKWIKYSQVLGFIVN